MPQLRQISLFIRAASLGSFTRAARESGITPQAASMQMRELERWLGVPLFTRTTRKIQLTGEGRRFLDHCEQGLAAIDHAVEQARQSTEEIFGSVTLAVSPQGACRQFVAPLLGRFSELYPRLQINLQAHGGLPDVVGDSIDVGVIFGRLPEADISARKIADVRTMLCAAPAYLKRHGVPRTLEELKQHRFIRMRNSQVGNRAVPYQFRHGGQTVTIEPNCALATDDGDAALAATLAGVGICQLASWRALPYLRNGRLKPLSLGFVAPRFACYVYMARRSQIPRKNRLLADFLYSELQNHPDLQPPSG